MIEAVEVGKRYGALQALDGVSFEIGRGEVVGLLGPNGAGKTTLIRILCGYFEPTAGRVSVDGLDVVDHVREVQERIGYLPEQAPLYPEMLVQEYLDMVADLRGVPAGKRRSMLSDAIHATELAEHLTRPIGALSKGFRQRVGIAQAILHRPKVLVLDEPTSGLDPTQVVHVRDLIRRLAKTTTVLFSTHILSEVEQVCERAIIVLGGRVKEDARLEDLRSTQRVVVGVSGADVATATAALSAAPGAQAVRHVGDSHGGLRFEVDGTSDELPRSLYRAVRDGGWELDELRPVVRDLETVFRELVQAEGVAA
jgi:ABC-2 type transport system ATP-binding protein